MVFSVWGLLLSQGLFAAEVAGLYRAEVAVAGRDEAGRTRAIRQGLEQVMRRVVPVDDLGSKGVRAVLAKPEACVLQYEYTGAYRYGNPVLQVDYDGDRIRQLLRKQGIETWGPERPEILIWLTLEDERPARFIGADTLPDLEDMLGELADEDGLAVTLPLGDLVDEQSLIAADIDAGNGERIREASARYETPAILTGRLAKKPGGIQGDWSLYRGSREDTWQTPPAADLRGALNSGLAGTYARLAAQLVPRSGSTATVELRVVGIASLEDSDRVSAYLGHLSPVTRAELLSVGAGDASFRLRVRGGQKMLEDNLAAGTLLRPASDEGLGLEPVPLTYRLMP